MGVIYVLVCVRKQKSNLPTNIRTTYSGEENTVKCRKMQTFEWNQIPALFYDSVVCFLFPKCAFFYQCCLIMFFITTVCFEFYDFCKTVLVKKYTPCQGIIWFSLTKVISFTLAFMWELNYTIKAWLSLRTTWKNDSRALPSNSHWGLRTPDPANPSSEKMTSQPTFFCCMYSPKV